MSERPQDKRPSEDDAILMPFFEAARMSPSGATLPDALTARMMADALAQMPAPAKPAVAPPRSLRPRSVWSRLSGRAGDQIGAFGRMLGGAPGLAVVAVAGLAGVWIGVAVPDPAPGLLNPLWSDAASDDWAEAALDLGEDEALMAYLDSY